MLPAPLENAWNYESGGFAVSSQLPGSLLLFWVAYFSKPAHVMNNSGWLCAAKALLHIGDGALCEKGPPCVLTLHSSVFLN